MFTCVKILIFDIVPHNVITFFRLTEATLKLGMCVHVQYLIIVIHNLIIGISMEITS